MNADEKLTHEDTRWDRSSWIAVTVALAIFALLALYTVAVWQVPSDGWAYNSPNEVTWRSGWTLTTNLAGIPSELRPGDVLLAVDGNTLSTLQERAVQFWRLSAPTWSDGELLEYSVLRGNVQLTILVPVRRLSPVEQIWYGIRAGRVGIVDPIATLMQVLLAWSVLGISVLVFTRKPRDLAAQAFLLMGVGFFFSGLYYLEGPTLLFYPFTSRVLERIFDGWALGIRPGMLSLVLTFPRPVSLLRRLSGVGMILIAVVQLLPNILLLVLFSDDAPAYRETSTIVGSAIWLPLGPLAVVRGGFLAFRLRDPAERAQIKWLTFGYVTLLIAGMTYFVSGVSDGGFTILTTIIMSSSMLAFPVILGIAITRVRLFDIDLIIRRTLVYSLLTLVLGGIYVGAVILLQPLFLALIGHGSDLAIIISTLAVATLFTRLRRWVQSAIDRRFFRRRYDATQVLAGFGTTARDEIELDRLTGELVSLVHETMQPATVSFWVRKGTSPTVK